MSAEAQPPFVPGDVWFNAYDQLREARERRQEHETLSVLQGEKLSDAIERFRWPWNRAFRRGPGSKPTAPKELADRSWVENHAVVA